MNIEKISKKLGWLSPAMAATVETVLRRIPAVRKKMETEYAEVLKTLEQHLKPYKGKEPSYPLLPEEGLSKEAVLDTLKRLAEKEKPKWQKGLVSGAVYHGDPEYDNFLAEAYRIYVQSNPLHADVWPGLNKMEAEIISITAHLLGAGDSKEPIVGAVTSGGTESILLAIKTYRDKARREKGITQPEVVLPVTAHAAFDKAAHYFGLRLVKIPVDKNSVPDLRAYRRAFSSNTVAAVGSAPNFPHGTIDPIEDMARIARRKGVGFHTDACLGAFILPFARELGAPVPPFHFEVPGVTSMSADTHKYGYASKGTSVVLYRGEELRRYQYFTATEWPGGLYFSPTMAGSRPGGLIAACWAALIAQGQKGYRHAAAAILETTRKIREAVQEIHDLRLIGESLFIITFGAAREDFNIYRVMDAMAQKGWSLNGLHRPPCLHFTVTLRHTQPGVADKFVEDLRTSVREVKEMPQAADGLAPVYGMAASLPFRGMVDDLLRGYMDVMYKV
ncbi:MAG: aminotransferase class V-fold PLP-dependent enzyme [Flavobacteriales bacterium]|nr:aminotransferase class V-fold PLP-dependent enzyme [Flavobacteriales bacterium]MDW8433112.1 aminotransferase class V-fold PLP-dependent enzyme [Flavobacteriales bacterium]